GRARVIRTDRERPPRVSRMTSGCIRSRTLAATRALALRKEAGLMLRRHKTGASTSRGGAGQESKRQHWLCLIGVASLAATMSAQTADVNTVFDHLLAVKPIEEAVIAPDGARVAWVSDGIRLTPIGATATAMRSVTARSVGSKAA